ncbi:hypothetical protein EUZ85_15030 [Hahella sp. KA22]|uniref:hypothetical protein n=1 Tax=Hahella sp. KA22 TaxID=1628392 RepID=UPI000FDF07C7|nr:hypothetical protein [Hahella sp. KA22]AZZ91974.1 hypothetical protein ENC22_12465 [Hahella sp. KA22]QAY55345.1 hypothetical protein EUZ85_15030 [Hahella sp. KA22]
MSRMDFDVEVKLLKTSPDTILTPLCIPDFQELKSNTTKNKDFITFEIQVKNQPVDKLYINISDGDFLVFQIELPASMREIGTHRWEWDGYDRVGTLDTKILKSSKLKVTVTAQKDHKKKFSTLFLKGEAAQEDWLDLKIDRSDRRVYVELRLNLKDGGARGVGKLPPEEAFQGKENMHWSDAFTERHIRHKSFTDLKHLVFLGVKKYWSRSVSINTGHQCTSYKVILNPIPNLDKAMDDISISYNTNGPILRSSNPGKIRGLISLIGNIAPEDIVYNVGWVKISGIWRFYFASHADQEFMSTAAHEIGHELLSAYSGANNSYSHKGSSFLLTQSPKPTFMGGSSYPESSEIDLMKYYNGATPSDFYDRQIATEKDVRSLIWISRIKFK